MKLYTNIKARRLQLGMSQQELAEKLGYTDRSMISKIEKGEVDLTTSKIFAFAKALSLTASELMDWDNENTIAGEPTFTFPIIGEVAAGYDSLALQEETGETEQIPLSWLHGLSPNEFFVLKVKGDSMYPDFQNGDAVLVRKTSSVDSGTVAVVGYDTDSATLKRVEYVSGEDWMKLIPRNHEYAPKIIEGPDLELCRVYGEVLTLIRHVK